MLPEISLNILDVAQNSISAGAALTEITVDIDSVSDTLTVCINDDGCGMTEEQLLAVTDPFYTTRKTRKIGLGVPFFKTAAENTGGSFEIASEVGVGTKVKAVFGLSHIDRMPLGDMVFTIHTLVTLNSSIDFLYRYTVDGKSFTVPTATVGQTTLDQMLCTMSRKSDAAGSYVDEDLSALFHGLKRINYTDEPGVHTEVLSLTKNTNNFRIILQQTWSEGSAAEGVDVSKFDFAIIDDNGKMDYDNSVMEDEQIIYRPWDITTGDVDVDTDISTRANMVTVSVAELTTARLMTDHRPILVVTKKETGEKVLSVPIVDYALLVKGNYNRDMDDQEYLDRQDEYNMTFFVHDGKWVSSQIIINSWRVVLNNEIL